ncbi:Ros/MucR family transcriptional regulator [Methylorubrum aminovorans]
MAEATERIELAAAIVIAFVTNNPISFNDLPKLLTDVHGALLACQHGGSSGRPPDEGGPEKPTAAQIKRSITPEALISFIDGKPYKMLKRHLRLHGLDPESYRARYGLPTDYPVTAQSHSERRAAMARTQNLGQKRRKWPTKAVE